MVVEKNNKKYNKSSVFLLPMLGINLDYFKDFYNVYYKNIYDKEKDVKRIYVVYKNQDLLDTMTTNIIKNVNYLDSYSIDNFTIFRYKILEIYLNDFNLFCNGSYSSFSNSYKKLILDSYSINKQELIKILNSINTDRKALADKFDVNIENIKEIYPIPDEIEETFTLANNYNIEI